jgi:hypothetical protein
MYSVLNCHNVAKYTEFYLGEIRFNVTSIRNAGCIKNSFPTLQAYINLFRGHVQPKSKLLYDWQSVCLGIEHPCGTCNQILLPVGMLLSEICGLVSVGRPLWREGGSAICSVIAQWSESLRTRNHILLSHLRLPQPGGPASVFGIYVVRSRTHAIEFSFSKFRPASRFKRRISDRHH